jgi:hypothetical protein
MLPRQPIIDTAQVGDIKLWLFDVSGSSPATACLWATDESKNIRWSANTSRPTDQYVSIDIVERRFYANTFNGWRHQIDVQTGFVLEQWFTK